MSSKSTGRLGGFTERRSVTLPTIHCAAAALCNRPPGAVRSSRSSGTRPVKQLALFESTKPALIGTPPAPKEAGREWLRSFLHPGQLPPEQPPAIVRGRRKAG